MKQIEFKKLNYNNFTVNSLDTFKRFQEVKECWRKIDSCYTLVPVTYTEDWTLTELRELAQRILSGIEHGCIAYGAFVDGAIVGFAYLEKELFGSCKQYVDLAEFYVSEEFRKIGIGKKLFELACGSAKELGATKLYISAHSAKESIAAYKKYGCVDAKEINEALAAKEPYDLQLEFEV